MQLSRRAGQAATFHVPSLSTRAECDTKLGDFFQIYCNCREVVGRVGVGWDWVEGVA